MRLPLIICAIALLAGCETAPVATGANSRVGSASIAAAKVPSAPSPEVGGRDVNAATGGALFGQVCIKTAPSFAGAPAALANHPFVQSSKTGTYFHQQLDLSFKVANGRCSMVMAGRGINAKTAASALRISKAGTIGRLGKIRVFDGRTYIGLYAGK